MNSIDSGHLPHPPDPGGWEQQEIREVLATRDITRLYRQLQKFGYSQKRIASMTGQSQPQVSAVIYGRRVMAYHVLARIADGLGIPRGCMGMAQTEPAG